MDFQFRDLVKEPPTPEEIYQLGELTDLGIRGLLNKRSQAYKKSDVEGDDLSEDELAGFLATTPRAIKRPLVTNGKDLVVGFQQDQLEDII